MERELLAVDQAKKKRDKARAEHDKARRELVSALHKAREAGASYRKLAERLGVFPTEVVRLLSTPPPKQRAKR